MGEIVDWTGAPARRRYPAPFIGLYDTPSNRPNESRPRPLLRPHTFQNITSWQRWEMTNYSRVIRAGIPNIDAALMMKANFAFGRACHVRSKSSTQKWGELMAGHINDEFYHDCNILGPEHDFWTTLTEISAALDCDGGYAVMFDDVSGKAQIIPTTRIGNGWGLQDTAKGDVAPLGKGWNDYGMWGLAWGGWASYGGLMFGYMVINDPKSPFNGARIIDGVIVDRNMVRIGVRILGFDEDGKMAYKDIPAAQIHLNFSSKWSDQIGFIPELAPQIMAIVNVQDFDYYIKQAMILSAAMSVTRKTRDGKPASGVQETDVDDGFGLDQENPLMPRKRKQTNYQEIGAGLVELSTDNNEEIEAVKFERPSMNEEEFVQRVERGYLAKHWPYDLIYAKEMGRAFVRAVGQQVKTIIHDRQRAGKRTIKWLVNRRIAWAMRKGLIPENNAAADPYTYEIIWPAEFTTDEGNDRQADRDDLKMGLTTRARIIRKTGGDPDHFGDERENEEGDLAQRAERLAKKYPFLDAGGWLERLDQRSPNPLGKLPAEDISATDADLENDPDAPAPDKKEKDKKP
jgi:hypothetical protein